MSYLQINNLTVSYEKSRPTLADFNLTIEQGELVSLLGPSGCGKTTTLRSVAGFIAPDAGEIIINGRDCTRLPPNKRDIGLVFQSYALFPHLTVHQNVAFGLRMRRVDKTEIYSQVNNALRMVGLDDFADRRPAQLSGGQQQRVALARATVIEPQLLLLDEPLSNLDAKLRVEMRSEIRRLQQRLGITTVYVTHDQVEAMSISDRVVVMNHGEIEQMDTPEAIFDDPQTPFVANFMGFENNFAATVVGVSDNAVTVTLDGTMAQIRKGTRTIAPKEGDTAHVFFREDAVGLTTHADADLLQGRIRLRTFQGNHVQYIVETSLGEFTVLQDSELPRFERDQTVYLQPHLPKWIAVFD